MDCIELSNQHRIERECISLQKSKWIIGLRVDVHTHNLKPGLTVAYPSSTRATKKIQKARLSACLLP